MSNTVAILVIDAEKTAVIAAVNALTPEYTIGFSRKVAVAGALTWETAPSHWYTNASAVPDDVLRAWQEAAPNLDGVVMFTAINAANPLEWAHSNLGSQGLAFVPDPPV